MVVIAALYPVQEVPNIDKVCYKCKLNIKHVSASDKVMAFPVHCVCKFVLCNFKPKQQWVIPFFIRTPPMEGKIPTGLFVPNQIGTPLDVGISYFQYPLIGEATENGYIDPSILVSQ